MKRFFKEWYMVIIPVCFAIFVLIMLTRIGHSTTMSVPIEFCKAQYTGRTRVEDIGTPSCAGYDQNMNCTVQTTTWSTQTRNETRVTCDFIEWR
jgi:hypothetical protein